MLFQLLVGSFIFNCRYTMNTCISPIFIFFLVCRSKFRFEIQSGKNTFLYSTCETEFLFTIYNLKDLQITKAQ